jgi:hypothetical protein
MLVDVRPEHYRPLYEISVHPEVADRWQAGSHGRSFEEFCGRLWDQVLAQFSVLVEGESQPCGLVSCTMANFRHQTAEISIFTRPSLHRGMIPLVSIMTMIEFLFDRKCDVEDSHQFFVVPFPNEMLDTDWSPAGVATPLTPVPSFYIGPKCRP